jgi:hypothetical protein
MRLFLITATLMLSLTALSPAARAQGQKEPVDVSPNTVSTGQPPFGGTFESRLERVGADIDGGAKQGWLTEAQAKDFAGQLTALRADLKAVRDRNGGKLPAADNSRLQDKVTALHKDMAEAQAAFKSKQASR